MDAVEQIISELKSATGWQNVTFKNDTFVFELKINDIRVIKGMTQGEGSLYLDYKAFEELPLSFVVHVGSMVHQYWVRGKHLHRTNGRPAYVSYDPDANRVIRRWCWNGLPHRIGGPAKEMISGLRVMDAQDFPNHQREEWDYMKLEWYQEGLTARFPSVSGASVEQGWRYRNKRTKQIDSPRGDLDAFYSEKVEFEWDSTSREEFLPVAAEVFDLQEQYEDGKMKSRSCTMANFDWKRAGNVLKHDKMTKFNEEIKTSDMLDMVDLWGNFYPESQVEFMLLTEFDRIGSDEGMD